MGEVKSRKKRKKGGRLVWGAQYILVLPFLLVLRIIPFGLAMRLGALIGKLAYMLDARHKDVIDGNLRDCLPEKSAQELGNIAVSVYENFGYSMVEFVRSGRYAGRPLEETFSFVNYEAYEKAAAKGMGVVLLTAHCGSWELMAMGQALRGHPFGIVVRPLDNPYIDRAVTGIRTRYGNFLINKQRAMREILQTLKDKKAVGILLDQNVTLSEGVFVEFFGKQACTNKGLALIAAKTRVPVVPAFIHRVARDRHEIVLYDELPLIDTGDKDADILANTQQYTSTIERFIRMYPDQWFWMHKRWKTKRKAAVNG